MPIGDTGCEGNVIELSPAITCAFYDFSYRRKRRWWWWWMVMVGINKHAKCNEGEMRFRYLWVSAVHRNNVGG